MFLHFKIEIKNIWNMKVKIVVVVVVVVVVGK